MFKRFCNWLNALIHRYDTHAINQLKTVKCSNGSYMVTYDPKQTGKGELC